MGQGVQVDGAEGSVVGGDLPLGVGVEEEGGQMPEFGGLAEEDVLCILSCCHR